MKMIDKLYFELSAEGRIEMLREISNSDLTDEEKDRRIRELAESTPTSQKHLVAKALFEELERAHTVEREKNALTIGILLFTSKYLTMLHFLSLSELIKDSSLFNLDFETPELFTVEFIPKTNKTMGEKLDALLAASLEGLKNYKGEKEWVYACLIGTLDYEIKFFKELERVVDR